MLRFLGLLLVYLSRVEDGVAGRVVRVHEAEHSGSPLRWNGRITALHATSLVADLELAARECLIHALQVFLSSKLQVALVAARRSSVGLAGRLPALGCDAELERLAAVAQEHDLVGALLEDDDALLLLLLRGGDEGGVEGPVVRAGVARRNRGLLDGQLTLSKSSCIYLISC